MLLWAQKCVWMFFNNKKLAGPLQQYVPEQYISRSLMPQMTKKKYLKESSAWFLASFLFTQHPEVFLFSLPSCILPFGPLASHFLSHQVHVQYPKQELIWEFESSHYHLICTERDESGHVKLGCCSACCSWIFMFWERVRRFQWLLLGWQCWRNLGPQPPLGATKASWLGFRAVYLLNSCMKFRLEDWSLCKGA